MGMTIHEFNAIRGVFRKHAFQLFPNEHSGSELRRTKAVLVDHTGVYIGHDASGVEWVIDHSPAGVQWRRYDEYHQGEFVTKTPPAVGRAQSVDRAISMVGKLDYSLPFMNCQHFSSWATKGKMFSSAVQAVGLISAVFLGAVLLSNEPRRR